jgi:hypothetical protein
MKKTAKKIFWGLFWVSAGVIVLLSNYGSIGWRFSLARDWPLVFVLIGISELIESLTNNR